MTAVPVRERLAADERLSQKPAWISPTRLSIATSIAVQALGILTGAILARELGPHGRGELAAIVLWPSILVSAGSLGVHEALTYSAARDRNSIGALVGTTAAICVVLATILCLTGLAIVPLIFAAHPTMIERTAFLYLSFIPLHMAWNLCLSTLNGLHRFTAFLVLRLSVYCGHALGILIMMLTGSLTIEHVALVYLGSFAGAAILGSLYLAIVEDLRLTISLGLAKSLLSFGIRSHWGNVSGLLNERMDQLLISIFLVATSLGLYVTAVTMTSLTALMGTAVSLVALPTISSMEAGPERQEAVRGFLRLTFVTSVCVTLPLLILTPELIDLFFGRAFGAAANIARVLLPATILLSMSRTTASLLRGMGRPAEAGASEFMALGVTCVGLAVLLPSFGLMGAAIASLLAYGASAFWSIRRISRAFNLSLLELMV